MRTSEIEALEAEKKGYYDSVNEANEYIRALSSQIRGMRLPNLDKISREDIKRAYEQIAPVMGVVNYIAKNVGEVMQYYELTHNGEYVEKHEVLELLRRPNDRYTLRKFGEAWAINKLLFGDAWVYAPKGVGKDRAVKEMYVLPSHKIATKSDGSLMPLEGIRLLGASASANISMEQVFESFSYNLDDSSFFGTSKIVAAAIYLSVMEKGMHRQEVTVEEGGASHLLTPRPDSMGVVMPKDKEYLEQIANGTRSFGKKKVIPFAVDVQELGNTPVDLNILASHKEAVTALCFVYELPVDLYYGQAKYENAKEAKKTIYEQNAIPMANEFAEDLLHYLKMDDYQLKVNTDNIAVLADKRTDVLDVITKMHGSVNELREAAGYERLEDSKYDEPIFQMGVVLGNELGVPYDISEE